MVMVIILAISLVEAAVVVALLLALAQFGIFVNAQGQVDNSTSSLASSLTPEQRDAICNPNNPLSMLKSVNTTESHLCGLPKASSSNITTTSAANTTTTRTEAPSPPSSPIPGLLMPEQPPSQPTQSESIQPPPAKSIAPSAVPPKSIAPSQAPPQFPPTG
jgi:hypothetical protein